MAKIYGKRIRLSPEEEKHIISRRNDDRRVLVIGDLHSPFIKEGYLEFCYEIKNKYNCNEIVFIGDICDNHASSYWESDPDGMSAGDELNKAKDIIQAWYYTFPEATVINGNHDLIPNRKAFTNGLSSSWIKKINEVLEVPNWNFKEEYLLDNVLYVHGTGRKAKNRAQNDLISIVQGHYHSESYIYHFVGENYKIFSLQVGSGIDRRSYSMAYGRHFNKPHINCGVILDNGALPILEYMKLN